MYFLSAVAVEVVINHLWVVAVLAAMFTKQVLQLIQIRLSQSVTAVLVQILAVPIRLEVELAETQVLVI